MRPLRDIARLSFPLLPAALLVPHRPFPAAAAQNMARVFDHARGDETLRWDELVRGLTLGQRTPGQRSDVTQNVRELAARVAPRVIEWRRHFHMYPELSGQEEQTAARVAEILRDIGVDELRADVGGHGVIAFIRGRKDGPIFALRADMDALPIQEETGLPYASRIPGVMHACGHDGHTAILLGTAWVLSQMRDQISGGVKLIFEPAEEAPPGGASRMVREGALHGVSAITALHAWPSMDIGKIAYVSGPAMAYSDRVKIIVRGKGSHAAAPWTGIDPIYVGSRIVEGIQSIVSREMDPRDPAVLTIGIVRGGTRANVIPDYEELEGTIRTFTEKNQAHLHEAVRRIAEHTALAHRAKVEVTITKGYPVTVNDPKLTQQMVPALHEAVGQPNVLYAQQSFGGESFSFFASVVPGFYLWLGTWSEASGGERANHTPRTLLDESALEIGVRVMSLMALRYPAGASLPGRDPHPLDDHARHDAPK